MNWQQVGAILGIFLSALALGAAIVSGVQTWRAHADATDALCNRVTRLEELYVKYRPQETLSIYYPGSRSCP